MNIKFNLVEDVVMTDEGLKKKCVICDRYLSLEDFPKADRKCFKREDICHGCQAILQH